MNYRYIIFHNPDSVADNDGDSLSKVFHFYKEQWSDLLSSLGSSNPRLKEEFYSSARVYALFCENEVIAIHLVRKVTNPNLQSDYWSQFTPDSLKSIRKIVDYPLMALTHFLVRKDYFSREKFNLAIPKVMAALTVMNQNHYRDNASVTICRMDIGVHKIAAKFGGVEISDSFVMHTTPVVPILIKNPIFDTVKDNLLFHSLWKKRVVINEVKGDIMKNDLKKVFDEKISQISHQLENFPFENRMAVIKLLSQQYHIIQNSTRYLALCAGLISVEDREEFSLWSSHLREELNHDVLLKNDLIELGESENHLPIAETRALIASNYYYIYKQSPFSHFGLILMLEGLSLKVCATLFKKIKEYHGIESKYLDLHGKADETHYPQGLDRISKMNHHLQQQVIESLDLNSSLYSTMIEKVKAECNSLKIAV